MKPQERKKVRVRKAGRRKEGISLSNRNYLLALIGLLAVITGYIFLSQPPVDSFWSLTLAPILLVLGYCVVVPISILYRQGQVKSKQGRAAEASAVKGGKSEQA